MPATQSGSSKAFRGRLRRQRKSGSTHPKIGQQSAHLNYPATLNSFRRCLKVIDTFRIDVAAMAGVPFCIIHGDDDAVVPLEPNSARLKARYEAAGKGDLIELIVAKGQGHNIWEGFFHCQELVDFLVSRAKAAAAE